MVFLTNNIQSTVNKYQKSRIFLSGHNHILLQMRHYYDSPVIS